jgi:CDP-6-deoxy-D-xylo-4-hexulose-3-dehydrase
MKGSIMDKREFIQKFINEAKVEFGSIPKFIHTTSKGSSQVNYSGPTFDDEELIAVLDSVLFGNWLSAGDKVHAFEQAFSGLFNHRESVMVNSGSSANLLMIAALKKYFGWNDGDEIILSVVGFPTTLSAVLANNLKPVFVDIEFSSLNFDLTQIADKVTNSTRAIFISPVLGNPPDFDWLVAFAQEFGIELILDNCDSLGSKWDGKYLTEYCVASSCSFYPAHHITTGEGGMISSDIPEVIKIARSMASWGRECVCVGADNLLPAGSCNRRFAKWLPEQDVILDHKYIFANMGYNLKPLDLQGAIGLAQLCKFEEISIKRILYKGVIDMFICSELSEVDIISEVAKAEPCWFGVPLICPSKEYKVKLVAHMEANHIQTRNYFAGNILLHPAYSYLDNWAKYPEANKVLERVFFLGCSPNYTDATLSYIINVMGDFEA